MEAFNTSRNLTNGVKMELFALYVVFSLVLYFPLLIVLVIALYTATDLIFSFILSFISTIIAIMRQRLIAMVFKDLEYGVKEPDYMDI
jgi:flagellar biosynthesis protein FliQ